MQFASRHGFQQPHAALLVELNFNIGVPRPVTRKKRRNHAFQYEWRTADSQDATMAVF